MHVSVVKKFLHVRCHIMSWVNGHIVCFCPVLVVIRVDEVKVNIRVATFRHHVGPYHVFLKEKKTVFIQASKQRKDKTWDLQKRPSLPPTRPSTSSKTPVSTIWESSTGNPLNSQNLVWLNDDCQLTSLPPWNNLILILASWGRCWIIQRTCGEERRQVIRTFLQYPEKDFICRTLFQVSQIERKKLTGCLLLHPCRPGSVRRRAA